MRHQLLVIMSALKKISSSDEFEVDEVEVEVEVDGIEMQKESNSYRFFAKVQKQS